MNIGPVEFGAGFPCRIVAELSNNHNGDRDRLGRLIDAAQAAGADVVKFQCYSAAELVALRGDGPAPPPWDDRSMGDLYTQAQTPFDWFPKIAAHCVRVGMPWFSSVFGKDSLAVLESVGCPAYKISHFERHNYALIDMIQRTHKPVIVSGIRDENGVRDAYGEDEKIYCPGGYPANLEDMHLEELRSGFWLGLSSHCLDPLVAPLAVSLGAKYLEYHFMLEAEPSDLESNVSLTERQFAQMVQDVRKAEQLCRG